MLQAVGKGLNLNMIFQFELLNALRIFFAGQT